MKHRGMFFILILTSVLPACHSGQSANANAAETKAVTSPERTITLTPGQVRASGLQSAEVVEREGASSVVVMGRVKARAGGEATVFAPFPGRLSGGTRMPQVGDYVSKGRQIADLEQQFMASEQLQVATTAIGLQVSVEQAQQEVELKRVELNRAQQLYEGGAISQKQLQTAEFELKQANTKLEGARRSKQQYDAAASAADSTPRRAPIVAPISGVVIAANSAMGQQVDPSQALLTIADLSTVWVEAAVHERDLPRISAARHAEITIPGNTPSFPGQLVTVGHLVDTQNRTVSVIFSVDNGRGALKLEMFVEARIPTGPSARMLVIPSSAVISEGGASVVYVEGKPGIFQRRVVSLGEGAGNSIVVISGLAKGEKVVTVGAQMLRSESLKSEIPVEKEEKSEEKK